MRSAADLVGVKDGLVRAVMASTDLTEEEVCTAVTWVDDAMLRSRFNTYHEFDKAVRHVKLATSVPADNLSFSIEAHGFRSLPDDKPLDRVLAAVAAILENTEALRQHVDDIPAM